MQASGDALGCHCCASCAQSAALDHLRRLAHADDDRRPSGPRERVERGAVSSEETDAAIGVTKGAQPTGGIGRDEVVQVVVSVFEITRPNLRWGLTRYVNSSLRATYRLG